MVNKMAKEKKIKLEFITVLHSTAISNGKYMFSTITPVIYPGMQMDFGEHVISMPDHNMEMVLTIRPIKKKEL
jgi:protocatechuate 3,4-dioxygenase beta subunit